MKGRRLAAVAAGILITALLGASPAMATPQVLVLNAFVADQMCLSGDIVQVDLSATVETSSPAQFQWDFTNDGTWDTGRLTSPDVSRNYPDEVNVTAEIRGRNAEGNRDTDTVSFATLRCE